MLDPAHLSDLLTAIGSQTAILLLSGVLGIGRIRQAQRQLRDQHQSFLERFEEVQREHQKQIAEHTEREERWHEGIEQRLAAAESVINAVNLVKAIQDQFEKRIRDNMGL